MKRNMIWQLVILLLLVACRPAIDANLELIPVKVGEKYGYINSKGEYLINPQFDLATFFRGDLALVQSGKKYGYINKKGDFTINPIYNNATVFREDIAWVVKPNDAPTAINTQGEILFTLREAEEVENFSGGLARFKTVDKYGYINIKGEVVIPPIYQAAHMFSEGLAAVKDSLTDGYGYIDTGGKIVINYQFDDATNFRNNQAIVLLANSGYGTIDKQGKYIINPQFSLMIADEDKYIIRLQDGASYGYCDTKGKIIINPQFEDCSSFGDSKLAAAKMNKKYGYIDETGKIVINPQFDFAFPFQGECAIVVTNNKVGTVDKEGHYVINPQFSDISGDAYQVLSKPNFNRDLAYQNVYSEFFDIAYITTRIQEIIADNSLNGLSYTANLNQIIGKYPYKNGKIKNVNYYQCLGETKLSKDALLFAFMAGDFFDKVSDGWWDYNYVLNKASIPTSYRCIISLMENGYAKEDILFPFLLKAYGVTDTGEKIQEVKKGNYYLTFKKKINSISITIHSNPSEELPSKEEEIDYFN